MPSSESSENFVIMSSSVSSGLQDISTIPLESPMDRQRVLLFSEHLSDVVFKVGSTGELINAHKVILSIASEVFYVQFNGGFAESEIDNRENPVIIEDIEPPVFKEVLRYIYCGEVGLTADNATDIYYVSEKYMLMNLRTKCQVLFKSTINEDNVLTSFNDNRQYKFEFVDGICLKFIRNNPLKCFRMKEFLTLSQPALELIAASPTMNCQREQLCEAIERWRKVNDPTATILPKLEHMQCRKLHSFSKFHYARDVDTDFTLKVEGKLYLLGLGVFIGKSSTSAQTAALVTVTIEPFNVSVSKTIFTKKDLYVEEIVFERLEVLKECRIKVTVKAEVEWPRTPPFFCLEKFQPIDSEGTMGLTIKHNNKAKNTSTGAEVITNCVAYLLFDVVD